MNTITKAFGMIALVLVSLFGAVANVYAAQDPLPVVVTDVKVNGDSITADQTTKTVFERDSELEVKVQLQTFGNDSIADVEITAFLTGNKDKVSDTTEAFDILPNAIYTKTLSFDLPQRLDDREYQLRVVVTSPNSDTQTYEYPLFVEATQNSIAIKEVTFSPNGNVMAGRALTAVARLKNYGQVDEDDVKVVVSIPELGVQEVDYINEVEKGETVSSEEVLLRIPASAKTGDYNVEVAVFYDDYDEKTKAVYTVHVTGDGQAAQATAAPGTVSGKTTIAVGVQAQTVARGENGVIYPLTVTNGANTAKTYTFAVSGAADWATTKISPSNVVILQAGETKQVYVYVAANEQAALGEHALSLDVKQGNDVVQQIPLKADVLESAQNTGWDGVKKALQVGVIALVVLIVVLGVVIAYQRRVKGGNNKEASDETIAQTYY
jgi:hypothetical protein